MLRVAAHASNVVVHAEPLDWAKPWELLTARSPHATGIAMPKLVRGNQGGAWQVRESTGSARLAAMVHRDLDRWVLARIHDHLSGFLLNQDDPAGYVGLEIAQDLRILMRQTWKTWHEAFTDEPALLSRFLRLMVSATDEDGDAVQVLVGPRKLSSIIGGTALSLAIASVWGQTAPRNIRPGNLLREITGDERTGHGCAPDRILGKRPGMCASSHDWQTNFVLLAIEGRLDLARMAEEPFTKIVAGQPSLSDTTGSGPMMMWLSGELDEALAAGTAALTTLLEQVERQHSELLQSAIERKEETV